MFSDLTDKTSKIGTWKVRNMETGLQNLAKHTGKLDRIILKQLVKQKITVKYMCVYMGFMVYYSLQTFLFLNSPPNVFAFNNFLLANWR